MIGHFFQRRMCTRFIIVILVLAKFFSQVLGIPKLIHGPKILSGESDAPLYFENVRSYVSVCTYVFARILLVVFYCYVV